MDQKLFVFWEEGMLAHRADGGVFDSMTAPPFIEHFDNHPECPERVRNMVSILRKGPISSHVVFVSGRPATVPELEKFHTTDYISMLQEADANGGKWLAAGTKLNPGSWQAARLAAGTTIEAMKSLVEGRAKRAYALVRPPGHHAQPAQADGYCFLNNAAIATQIALDLGLKKAVTIDIDVHFGNGTFEGFYERDDVLTISLHMDHGSWGPTHLQSLQADQLGRGKGLGYNLNIPLPCGTGDRGYELAFSDLVLPAVDSFQPEVVVFVIGQDSSQFDPNGRMSLSLEGYRRLGQMIREMADKHSDGKVLVVQEGGYHLTYSAFCLHATLEGVLNLGPEPLLKDPIAYYPEDLEATKGKITKIKETWNEVAAKSGLAKEKVLWS